MRTLLMLAPMMMAGLSACGGAVDAPSLAPRAVERRPIAAPDEATEVASPADPALLARLAPIVAAAERGDGAFKSERRSAEAAVTAAVGAAAGSDRWLSAQQALSALETALGPARDAAAAIDAVRAEPANAAPGNRAAIDAAAAQVDVLGEAQRQSAAALAGRLG